MAEPAKQGNEARRRTLLENGANLAHLRIPKDSAEVLAATERALRRVQSAEQLARESLTELRAALANWADLQSQIQQVSNDLSEFVARVPESPDRQVTLAQDQHAGEA